jgi:hypothetical protein
LQVETPNSEAAILARLIQAKEHMSRDVAEYLLSIDFSQEDIDLMNFLAEQARRGLLSQEEATELDSYLHVGAAHDHAVESPSSAENTGLR